MEKTRGSGYKLQQERFNLNVIKNCFTVRTVSRWNDLPREVVESPSLEVFKMHLNRVLHNLIWAPFPMKGWTRYFEVPSNLG